MIEYDVASSVAPFGANLFIHECRRKPDSAQNRVYRVAVVDACLQLAA